MKYFFGVMVATLLVFGVVGSVSAVHFPGHVDSIQTPTNQGGITTPTNPEGIITPTHQPKSVGLGLDKVVDIENPIKADTIAELFEAIIDILLIFAIPIIVFFIILAGFKYVTARGNESTISEAHMALLYALIGGVLILGAKVLISVIGGTVDQIRDTALLIVQSFYI